MKKGNTAAAATETPHWLSGWRPYAIITVLLFLLYGRTIGYDFTNLDDTSLIRDNQEFLGSDGSISKAFGQNVFAMLRNSGDTYYRPLLMVSLIIDYSIGGDSPAIYHLTNLLLHILACCLLFYLLRLFSYMPLKAFLFTAIFAVHPVFTQVVAWVPGRNDSLLAVFVLLSFIFLLHWLKERKVKQLVFHFLFFLAALFTKETTLFVAILFFFYLLIERKRTQEKIIPMMAPLLAGWIVLIGVFLLSRSAAMEKQPHVPFGEVAMQIIKSSPQIVPYTGKLLLPFGLSVFPVGEDITFVWGIICVLAIAVLFFFSRDKKTLLVLWGIAWFVILLLPTLIRTNPDREQIFFEHRLYVPAIGLMIALVELSAAITIKTNKSRSWISFTLIGVYAIAAFIRSDSFKDEGAFWMSAVSDSPHSSYAWEGVGTYHYVSGDIVTAQKEFEEAIRLDPNATMALNNLGKIYLDKGMNEQARVLLRHAMEVRPSDKVCDLLGEALFALDSLPQAEIVLKKGLELNPEYTDAMNDLAVVYARNGNYNEAMALWKRVEEKEPERSAATINIYKVLLMQQKYDEAETYRELLLKKGVNVPPIVRDSTAK